MGVLDPGFGAGGVASALPVGSSTGTYNLTLSGIAVGAQTGLGGGSRRPGGLSAMFVARLLG